MKIHNNFYPEKTILSKKYENNKKCLKGLTRLDDEYELVRLEFEVEFWRLPLPKLADLGPVELK